MTAVGPTQPNSHVGLGKFDPSSFRWFQTMSDAAAGQMAAPLVVPPLDLPSWRDRFRGMWWGAAIAVQVLPDPTAARGTAVSLREWLAEALPNEFGLFPPPDLHAPDLHAPEGPPSKAASRESAQGHVPPASPLLSSPMLMDALGVAIALIRLSSPPLPVSPAVPIPTAPDCDRASADPRAMDAIALPLALWYHDDPDRLAAILDQAWAEQGLAARSPTLSAIAHLWAQWLAAALRTGHQPDPKVWLAELATLPDLPAAALHLAQSLHLWAGAAAPIHWVQASLQRLNVAAVPGGLATAEHPHEQAAAIALYAAMTTPEDFSMRLGRLQRAIAPQSAASMAPWLGAVTGAELGYSRIQALGAIAGGKGHPIGAALGCQEMANGMANGDGAALTILGDRLWGAWVGCSPPPMSDPRPAAPREQSQVFPRPNLVIGDPRPTPSDGFPKVPPNFAPSYQR